ncbi:MAG: 2-dehydropantoate 2-reductase [Desulfobulbales bacterium]|nr:2-dehydropantoate 2-reductase [Desulfobulbales bacterium]
MKIAVIGPGAMGCLLAVSLCEENEVAVLDHRRERAALLNRQGLLLEEPGRSRVGRVNVTADPQRLGPAELVILCVKSVGFQAALRNARLLCNRDSLLLALQNGIGHLPLLAELPADTAWAVGVTSHGATLVGPGHVIHRGQGLTRIGAAPQLAAPPDQTREKLVRAARVLTRAGIETELVDEILNEVWAKLLINIGINALTVIHDCPNGALLEIPDALAMMRAAIREGQQVAEKSNIVLAGDPLKAAVEVCRATATNTSSMLQDVRHKRATEIDAINGALIRKGAALGVAVPVNRELTRQIKEIEGSYRNSIANLIS